jgi:hypothetical protein
MAVAVGRDFFRPLAVRFGFGGEDAMQRSFLVAACSGLLFTFEVAAQPAVTASSVTIQRSHEISETNDDHPGFEPTSRSYRIVKVADPGHVIVDARLVETSAKASDLVVNIAPDRRSAEVRFRLTAGPKFDRWSGWLRGQLILTMQRQD